MRYLPAVLRTCVCCLALVVLSGGPAYGAGSIQEGGSDDVVVRTSRGATIDTRLAALADTVKAYISLRKTQLVDRAECDVRSLCDDEGYYVETSPEYVSLSRGFNALNTVKVASFPRAVISNASRQWASTTPADSQQIFLMQAGMRKIAEPFDLSKFPSGGDNPFLPWPPRRPSAAVEVTSFFGTYGTLGGIANRIAPRIRDRGYDTLRYFSVPGGFAISTDLERVDDDGVSYRRNRWTTGKRGGNGSLWDYLNRLMRGERDRFRMFVFIVTDQDFQSDADLATADDLKRWKISGRPGLSSNRAAARALPGTRIWLFTYEFKSRQSRDAELVGNDNDPIRMSVHLEALGLR